MANTIYTQINLDVGGKNNIKVWAKQYDSNDRYVTATIYNGDSVVSVDADSVVTINARREDDSQNSFVGEVNSDGTVNLPITYWMTYLPGTVLCDVSLYLNGRLSSLSFKLKVEESATEPSEIIPDESKDIVTALIEDVEEATSEAESATSSALSASQLATTSAEYANSRAEFAQNSANLCNAATAGAELATQNANSAASSANSAAQRAEDAAEQLDVDLSDIRSAIADNTTDIDSLTDRIDTLSSADVSYGSGTVKDELDKLEDDGTSLGNRLTSAEGNITSLNIRTTSLENHINNLDATDVGYGEDSDVEAGLDQALSDSAEAFGKATQVQSALNSVLIQLGGKENTTNRINVVDDDSDDFHYPTAGAVHRAIQGVTVDAYSKAETDSLLDNLNYSGDKEPLIYAGDGAMNFTSGTPVYKAGSTYSHLTIPISDLQNVELLDKGNFRTTVVYFNQEPLHEYEDGQSITSDLGYVNVRNATINTPFSANSYAQWNSSSYLWINTSYEGRTINHAYITLTKKNGERINLLLSGGGYDLRALGTKTLDTRLSTLESDVSPFNIENPAVQKYLNNIDYSDDSQTISDKTVTAYTKTVLSAASNGYFPNSATAFSYKTCRPAGLTFTWDAVNGATKYIFNLGERTYYTTSTTITIDNLIPNKEYKYEIYAMVGDYIRSFIKSGTFNTTGRLRMINIPNIFNVRDLGGWNTIYGKKVKFGKIFRGAAFNTHDSVILTDDGKDELLKNGITAEVDLRGETGIDYVTPFLEERYHRPLTRYDIGMSSHPEQYYAALSTIIELVSEGKGVYVHCMLGADRTGSVCMLLGALLGVSGLDCSVDYELTSFNSYQQSTPAPVANSRATNYLGEHPYPDMMAFFETNYPSATYPTLTDKVVKWYLDIGGSMEQIYAFRNAMLDGGTSSSAYEVKFTATPDAQTMTPVFSCDNTYAQIENAINCGDIIKFSLDGSQVGMDNNYTTMNYNYNSYSGYIRVNILVGFTNYILQVNNNDTIYYNSYDFVTQ